MTRIDFRSPLPYLLRLAILVHSAIAAAAPQAVTLAPSDGGDDVPLSKACRAEFPFLVDSIMAVGQIGHIEPRAVPSSEAFEGSRSRRWRGHVLREVQSPPTGVRAVSPGRQNGKFVHQQIAYVEKMASGLKPEARAGLVGCVAEARSRFLTKSLEWYLADLQKTLAPTPVERMATKDESLGSR